MNSEKSTSASENSTAFEWTKEPESSSSTNAVSTQTCRRGMRNLIPCLKEKSYLFVCFLLPALLMWLIYIAMRVYPFGEESVLVLDLNGQYVYYFEALRKILHGEGSILYSFGRALGGEFLGIFAYYLASPFSFLVALFPKAMITEALLVLFLLKTGLCGLNFGIYIDKTRPNGSRLSVVLFSTMYALCAYAVVQQHNTMWIDNMLFLPLILLGIEQLIQTGKYKLFVVTLSLAILSNYYIGYMTCLFVAVYFFFYYFSRSAEERNPRGVSHHFLKSFARIAVFSLIVICIASIIILPAYYSLTFGKTTFSDPSYEFTQKFDFLDAITKMYFGSYDTVRPAGLPFLYCGMLTFILMPLFFFAPHIKTREKIATGILVVFFFISFNGSTIDLIWHGFQRPNWLNYRYSFMLCFLFVLMAYKAYEKLCEIGFRSILCSIGGISILLLILQKMDYDNLPDLSAVWASLLFCGLYLCVLRACTNPRPDIRQTAAGVLTISVCLEMFCGGLANLVSLDQDVSYSSRTSYRTFIDRVQPIVDEVKSQDDSFYRMKKTLHRKTNDNFALGMYGLSNSTSTLNAKVIRFLNLSGLASKSHWSKYVGGTPVLDSITGIKYLIAETKDTVSPLYTELTSYNEDLIAYRNPYALSLAYGVDESLLEFDFLDEDIQSPFERLNLLLTYMTGSEETLHVFRKAKVEKTDTLYCDTSMVVGHREYTPSSSSFTAAVKFTLHADSNDMLYCYFPSDYPREADLSVNGHNLGTFFGNESFCIKQIGSFEEDEEIRVSLTLKDDELYLANGASYFYYLDEDVFCTVMEQLAQSQFEISDFTEDHFSGTIRVAEGQDVIFTSIPYDEGWTVKANGEKIETFEILSALTGFRLPAGEYTLELIYQPDCVRYGFILSCAGIGTFAVICLCEALYTRHKKKKGYSL